MSRALVQIRKARSSPACALIRASSSIAAEFEEAALVVSSKRIEIGKVKTAIPFRELNAAQGLILTRFIIAAIPVSPLEMESL
jgi:hypothetical protein